MKNKKNIPPRNYLIIVILAISIIFGTMYFFEVKEINNKELTDESFLISTSTVSLIINTLEELETTLIESPNNLFIFTGYTDDLNEYNLEEDLKPIIDEYSLKDQFYYLDITELKNEENYFEDISKILGTEIESYPVIIYIANDEAVNKIYSINEMIKSSDFENLLSLYEFEKSE